MFDDKTKNIIEMAMSFTGMTRVFEPKASEKIHQKLLEILGLLDTVDYEKLHSEFCNWFMDDIKTAANQRPTSYGQAAKVFDVAMKVIVSYCHLPTPPVAERVKQRLHCGVDNRIMSKLITVCHPEKRLDSLSQVKKCDYEVFQNCLNSWAEKANLSAVDYDDFIFRKQNRGQKEIEELR